MNPIAPSFMSWKVPDTAFAQGDIPLGWMAKRLAVILFMAELVIMLLLPNLKILENPWLMLLLDATLLSMIAAPISHHLVFLPLLSSQIKSTAAHHMQHIVVLGTVLAKSAVIIFTVEAGIMLVLRVSNTVHEGLLVTLFDALVITSTATPAMIYWIAPGMKYGKRSRISKTLPAFFALLIPTCLVFISVVMAFYHSEVENKNMTAESAAQHHLSILESSLANDLATVASDLLSLSRQTVLLRAIRGDESMVAAMKNDWLEFMQIKGKYSWIQLADPSGQEMMFKTTLPQSNISTSFSQLVPDLRPVLRLENGGIHVFSPRTELLRQGTDNCQLIFSTPIPLPDRLQKGILSLALSCLKLFQHSLSTVDHFPENIYLLNENSLILYSVGSGDNKLAELSLFASHQPEVARLMDQKQSGQIRHPQGIFTFGTLSLLGTHPPSKSPSLYSSSSEWRLVTHLPPELEEKSYSIFRENVILLALVTAPVLMVGVWLFVNTVVKWNQAEVNLEQHAQNLENIIHERTQQLVKADRMTSLGVLTSGMTTEISNPNAFIAGNVHFLKLYWEKAQIVIKNHADEDESGRLKQFLPEIEDILEGILTSSHRITRLLTGFKSYTKHEPAPMQAELCHLRIPLENAMRLMRQELGKISLDVGIPEDMVVYCDPQELTQAFVHMFRNALESFADRNEKKIIVSAWVEEKGVCIRFEDNGPEIAVENLKQIFDPFSPTAHRTQGFGLSLPIVQGIITQHKGWIEAIQVANGAAFQMHMPIPGLPEESPSPPLAEKNRS